MNVTLTGQMTNTFPSKGPSGELKPLSFFKPSFNPLFFLSHTSFLSGAESSFITKGVVSDADLSDLDATITQAVDAALADAEALALLEPDLRQKLEDHGKV